MMRDSYILPRLVFLISAILAMACLTYPVMAENNTTALVQDTLEDVSQKSHTAMEWIKANIPYEIWFLASVGLGVVVLFTRAANTGYSSVWKLGLYAAIVAVIVWFLLIR